jgi:hypothetical protein
MRSTLLAAGRRSGWSQMWSHSPGFAGVRQDPSVTVSPGHGRWRTPVNAGQHCWKACWGQPLRSSNLLSSATSDQAIHQAGHAFGLGPQGCVVSFAVSFSYAYRYKTPKDYLYGHIASAGARLWVLLRLWPLTGHPGSERTSFAAVAVTMGEHLRSNSAGRLTQIAEYARMGVTRRSPLLVCRTPHYARTGRYGTSIFAVIHARQVTVAERRLTTLS